MAGILERFLHTVGEVVHVVLSLQSILKPSRFNTGAVGESDTEDPYGDSCSLVFAQWRIAICGGLLYGTIFTKRVSFAPREW